MPLRHSLASLTLCLPLALGACQAHQRAAESGPAEKAVVGNTAQPKPHRCPKARAHFNRAAVRLNLPLYWMADTDGDGVPDPDEIAELLFYPDSGRFFDQGQPTPALAPALARIEAWMDAPVFPADLSPEEQRRRARVVEELDQGQPILVRSDLRGLSEGEKAFVRHMLDVARSIDALYAIQTGTAALGDVLAQDDPSSRSLFRRNWGPKCLAPKTENDPECSAIAASDLKPKVGVYPASIQDEEGAFCKRMEATAAFADPFTVVREAGPAGELAAVPYSEAWPELMRAAAKDLRAAADALDGIAGEEALRAYLDAAATSFETNDWKPADEAWAAMNGRNSKWYVRVGPDEVYWEPCSLKAGIHLTLARINPEAIAWQDKLTPRRQALEDAIAAVAGAPYAARQVSFQLPDFIDIVINAGDDRDPMGATIGQSLPNWGPVANEGRGRTVAMSNLYTDSDSLQNRRAGAESLLTKESMARYTDSSNPGLLSTILHEAAHNLGPSHEYKVGGKVDTDCFGGPLASTAEELKAQTAALWFIDYLSRESLITADEAAEGYVDAITWAFGHISRGMFDGSGRPKHYSQLAAIQIGFLMDEGALTFDADAMAANGRDKGAFTIHFDKLVPAADKLMREVGAIKAKGARATLEALIERYVKGQVVPQALITDRLLRHPKASFVFSVVL